ncbi:MAG: hypothetical protein PGN25_14750 [Methylorubrum populi]
MLRNIMRWQWQGVGEKVRWSVYGSVAGEPVGFELRKFGFTILRIEGAKVPASRIIGQLQTASKEVETFLEPYARSQVDQGEVLIVNRSSEFDNRHQFFRQLAAKAYAKSAQGPRGRRSRASTTGPVPAQLRGVIASISAELNFSRRADSEGFFHSTAMIDAYFSALEHRLVLLRAFMGKPLMHGELRQLLALKWDDKLKEVLPAASMRTADQLLGSMRRIKERIRNPFAHGGVENDNGSLFFRLPHVGAIPANFSRFGKSVRFTIIPIGVDDHAECCATFDQLDALLSTGDLSGPHRLLEAGIDPVFDEKSLKEYAEATVGGEAGLEEFIDRWGHEWERHANMDY